MTLKLYELSEGIKAILAVMEEEGQEENWDAALAELRGDFQDKAVNLAKLHNLWEAEVTAYMTEITRLQGHLKAAQLKQDWVKAYLKANMEQAGIAVVKGDTVSIRLQNSPLSVTAPTLEDVPLQYRMGTVRLGWRQIEALNLQGQAEASANKRAILADFKATGEAIPGVEIVQGRHVVIR